MSVNEIICQQMRQLLRISGAQRANQVIKRCRIRGQRCPGGQELQASCSATQSVSSNQVPLEGKRCIVPLLHIWMRLHSITSISSPLIRQRCIFRFRLQQRSLLQNVRFALSVRWHMLYSEYFPPPDVPPEDTTRTEERPARNAEQGWLQRIVNNFNRISQKLEYALKGGPRSFYINTSAAMEVININDIFNDLNSAVIEYIINNEENITDPFSYIHTYMTHNLESYE